MPEVSPQPSLEAQPAQPQAPQGKGISWKKIIVSVVAIAMVAGIIAGALYWYFVINEEETTTEPVKVSTPSSKQATPSAEKDEPTEPSDSLAKTYKDNFFNVSFKYPEDWEEKTKSGIEACEPSVGPKNVKDAGVSVCEFGQGSAEEMASLADKDKVSMKKNIEVAGKSTIRQVVFANNQDMVYAYIGDVTFKNQTGYMRVTGWPKGTNLTTKEFVELFDKVLATFKFLD